jgi:7-carboxy-7-deazaguanine synthase
MPQPPTLKIIEIFPSLQGEGLRQGEPTIFVRFAGCNLECSFCDTRYAWRGGRDYSAEQAMDKINRIRNRFPARWVCLTGGEPLLHDLRPLVSLLHKEKFKVQVETNATLYYPLAADWFTISPKPPAYFRAAQYRARAKEVKLVATRDLRLEVIKKLRRAFPERTALLLQPQSNQRWSQNLAAKLLKQAIEAGLNNIRVSVQLHKILRLR